MLVFHAKDRQDDNLSQKRDQSSRPHGPLAAADGDTTLPPFALWSQGNSA